MMKKERMLQILRRLMACVIFVALVLTLLTRAERLLMEVNGERTVVAHEGVPAGSVDVAFIGSSHVYGAVIPQKLMDDHGIASVNAASGNQGLWHSVYELEWLLQRQRPRVVVVDLFSLGWLPRSLETLPDKDYGTGYYSFLGLVPRALPWTNLLKYSVFARETLLDSSAPPYLTTISVRHPEIWNLTRRDFLKARGESISHVTFNYFYLYEIYGQTPDEGVVPDEGVELSAFDREQLLRLCQLCEENGIDLVLMALPQWTDSTWLGLGARAQELAKEQGAAFLSLDTITEESGFVFETDMADVGHVNYSGAQKITGFLGQYLKDHFDLPDRREDDSPLYDVWKKRPYQYEAYAAGHYLQYVREWDEWVSVASQLNEDYLIVLAMNPAGEAVTVETVNMDILSLLGVLGLEEVSDFLDEEGGYYAILEGQQIDKEEITAGDLDYAALIDGHPLTLRTDENGLEIQLDRQTVNCGHGGLNVVVYNKVECRVVASRCLDLNQESVDFGH